MKDSKKLKSSGTTIYQTNENCQVFTGPISGCVFAMPGATVNQSPVQTVQQEQSGDEEDTITPDQLARAILKVQHLFWANSSYAVLFCVLRDCFGNADNRSRFEREVALLPFDKRPTYSCTPGVVSSTMNDNPYMDKHVDTWQKNGARERVLKLANAFKEAVLKEKAGEKFQE